MTTSWYIYYRLNASLDLLISEEKMSDYYMDEIKVSGDGSGWAWKLMGCLNFAFLSAYEEYQNKRCSFSLSQVGILLSVTTAFCLYTTIGQEVR